MWEGLKGGGMTTAKGRTIRVSNLPGGVAYGREGVLGGGLGNDITMTGMVQCSY